MIRGFKRDKVAMQHLGEAGAACSGMSSLGPMVYAIGGSNMGM
ncbi:MULTISPECIES: hypothetical protein [Methanoculleus]|nr:MULTISPECIES: hypothetical protein [Methanoculleus]